LPIVGVGASAGGIDALTRLVAALPRRAGRSTDDELVAHGAGGLVLELRSALTEAKAICISP
jgi:chemotaxis response regulator CheB